MGGPDTLHHRCLKTGLIQFSKLLTAGGKKSLDHIETHPRGLLELFKAHGSLTFPHIRAGSRQQKLEKGGRAGGQEELIPIMVPILEWPNELPANTG